MYQLVRRTPEGVEKKHSPVETKREAAQAAGMCLYDNGFASKRGAQLFSKLLERSPVGLGMNDPSGYQFRIDKV